MADQSALAGDTRVLLVADEDRASGAAIADTLGPEGYRLLVATDARTALDLLASHEVGVVLVDLHLAGPDGDRLFRRFRELYPRTLRIAMGEDYGTEDLIDLINEGAVYKFLQKPVALAQLREVLRKAFLAHNREAEKGAK
jgi:DNA-binding NtrC family response regulator